MPKAKYCVWPYDWPFKRADHPTFLFENSNVKKLFDEYVQNHPDCFRTAKANESIFITRFFEQEELQDISKFCQLNGQSEAFRDILGALTEYTEADAKYFFIVLHFVRYFQSMGVLEVNPEGKEEFGRLYRGLLIHSQIISRKMVQFKMYRIPGTVEEAVTKVLVDDGLFESINQEDIFEDMSVMIE